MKAVRAKLEAARQTVEGSENKNTLDVVEALIDALDKPKAVPATAAAKAPAKKKGK